MGVSGNRKVLSNSTTQSRSDRVSITVELIPVLETVPRRHPCLPRHKAPPNSDVGHVLTTGVQPTASIDHDHSMICVVHQVVTCFPPSPPEQEPIYSFFEHALPLLDCAYPSLHTQPSSGGIAALSCRKIGCAQPPTRLAITSTYR